MHPKSPPEFPPVWATAWGEDPYGLWIELTVKEVSQVFRWIEPGKFYMGSPEDEPERLESEVYHQVTLSQGFWLADTAVTQALWQAVMGNNPSYFKGAHRPVETVSWDDTQRFLTQLKAIIGAQFSLPWEAQWEYACRAGTTTPFSFGDNISSEQVNFDGGNSYEKGKKSLYRKETVAVKSLPCNPWGLYEMHGNVWEWCRDSWQEKLPAQPVMDPQAIQTAGSRVCRGGSWFDYRRLVRSAYRNLNSPAYRYYYYGFRLSLEE